MRSQPDLEKILAALEELSSREEQERLWLSTGANGAEVSSSAEAVCTLFNDSGLSGAMDWSWRQRQGGREVPDLPVYSDSVDRQINALSEMLRKLPNGPPHEVINSSIMSAIRGAAGVLLSELRAMAV